MRQNKQITRTPSIATLAKIFALLLIASAALACEPKTSSTEADQANAPGPEAEASVVDYAAEIPEDQTLKGATPSGNLFVVATPSINPVPFQKLVEYEVRVFEDAEHTKPAKDVELDQVRPLMPAHRHGMKTKTEIEKTGDGVFRVHGLKFHMKGEGEDGHWTLSFLLRNGAELEEVTFDIQCCRA